MKYTHIRNRGSGVVVGEHCDGLSRLQSSRLVFSCRGCRSSALKGLECAKKVEYLKGTGLSKQQRSISVLQHAAHPNRAHRNATTALAGSVIGFLGNDSNRDVVLQ